MTGAAVRACLDQRGTAATASPVETFAGGEVHGVRIVAVDEDALEAVRRRAIGCRVGDGGHRADGRVLHVHVVLAHEDHRQLPYSRQVQRLVKSTDIGGAVAKERDSDSWLATV